MTLSDISMLIPLYASAPQLPRLRHNIESHAAAGGPVILSDQHGLDDTGPRLASEYRNVLYLPPDPYETTRNWVANTNRLITACRTPFFRILPHDDTAAAEDTRHLVQPLRDESRIVVSHGRVTAIDEAGNRLPQKDEPKRPLRPVDDDLIFSAGFFWQGLYSGAWKAAIRRDVHGGGPLLMRPTPTLRHTERAWLFALSLLGQFTFTERASLTKCYWSGSLTDSWRFTAQDQIDAARVMADYVTDLLPDNAEARALRFNLHLNAMRRANWYDGLCRQRPAFEPPAQFSDAN
ncbi:hypothetical protein [Tropicibacter sp. S64]|uniref:hypothetical protein n=1 Tax=Tropicibacter sp. S64 TaxID=3415122 RepID=UPI003C7A7319